MKKLFLLTALFVAAAFPSCSKHDGVETPDWPEPQPLAIAFAEGNELFFGVDETKTVHYTITGGSAKTVVTAEMQNPDDAYTVETTPISATEGTITITAKKPSNENRIIVTVSDGSQTLTAEIAVSTNPNPEELAITFAEGNLLLLNINEPRTIHYTITGGSAKTVVTAEMQNPDDAYTVETTPISATEGTITITAKKPSNENRIIVTVSDGSQTLTAEIAVSTNPNPEELAITFAEGNLLLLNINEPRTIHYTITGGSAKTVVTAEMQNPDDAYTVETTPISATEGTITITAKKPSNENRIIVTVSDGSQTLTAEIAVSTNPNPEELAITFAEGNLLLLNINEPRTIHYTITGGSAKTVVTAEMQNPDDAYTVETTPISATEGTITITAKKPSNENRIIVTVSDGLQTVTAEIAVTLRVFDGKTVVVEIPGSLGYWLAPYDQSSIIELTVIGTLNSSDIATLKNLPNLAILDMENVNLEALPADTFRNKTSLTSVKLPKTLKKIGSYAFSGCSGLTSVTIPDSVTSIGDRAFQDCSSLTSVTIPDSVTEIYNYAFYGCSSLTSVTIPDSVTEICYCAFSGCRSLTSVTIGNSVKYIENYAFDGCSGLTSVTIGNSVTFIDSEAFRGCSSLTRVYCKAIVPPIIVNNTFDKVSATATLYVPTGCKAAYAAATEWSKFKTIEETQF